MNVYAVKLYAKGCLAGRTIRADGWLASRVLLSVLLGIGAYFCRKSASGSLRNALWCMAGECAILFASAWLLSALRQGSLAWHIRCAEGAEPSCIQVLYWLRRLRSLKSGRLTLAVRVRKAAWYALVFLPCLALLAVWIYAERKALVSGWTSYTALLGAGLCAVPAGITAALLCRRYDAAAYLLAKDPALTVHEAVNASRRLMRTQCGRMLRFKLSFLPWFLSCVFVVPIAYVLPYYRQSVVCMLSGILSAASCGSVRSAG